MFFHSWADIGRVGVVAAIVFLMIVAMLRLVGQQALAKMSGYDIIFTVTIGSIIATVILSRDVTVSDAAAAVITLVGLQELVRWLQSRWLTVHHAVRQQPHVVLWDGNLLEDRLRATSTSADEVRAAVRRMGIRSLSDVRVVVLENDGEWSVVPKSAALSDESAFIGLPIPDLGASHTNDKRRHAVPVPPDRLP